MIWSANGQTLLHMGSLCTLSTSAVLQNDIVLLTGYQQLHSELLKVQQ